MLQDAIEAFTYLGEYRGMVSYLMYKDRDKLIEQNQMAQKSNSLIKCPYELEKTWSVVKWALEHSSNDEHWWTIEEYREQGLLRAILNPVEKLKRDIVLNVSIIEKEREALTGLSENFEFYEMKQWVEVRIDQDIYPYYKRTENPEAIIESTQDCLKTALKIKQK